MFAAPGTAYVYRIYGMHTCLNVVCGPRDTASAVLLRAAAPLEGADAMRLARWHRAVETRRADRANPAHARERIGRIPDARLADGPGMLAAAFEVTLEEDGIDLLDPASPLRLEPLPPGEPARRWVATPRVGVAAAGPGPAERPWRFVAERLADPGPGASR